MTLQAVLGLLTEEQLPEVLALQERVISALDQPEFLEPLSEEEFLYIVRGNGMLAGAFVDDRLIAFRAMLDPGEDDEHLGIDAGIPPDRLSCVLYSEISCVDPDFRGHGLQTIMGKWLMEHVDSDRYPYICTTVAPFNIASLKDKFALGLRIKALKVKYGTKLRYILFKDLQESGRRYGDDRQVVAMKDTIRQQELLASGWIGIRIEERSGEWHVEFANS